MVLHGIASGLLTIDIYNLVEACVARYRQTGKDTRIGVETLESLLIKVRLEKIGMSIASLQTFSLHLWIKFCHLASLWDRENDLTNVTLYQLWQGFNNSLCMFVLHRYQSQGQSRSLLVSLLLSVLGNPAGLGPSTTAQFPTTWCLLAMMKRTLR